MNIKKSPLPFRKLAAFFYGLAYAAKLATQEPKLFFELLPRKIYHLLPFSTSLKLGMRRVYLRVFSHNSGSSSDYQLRVDREIATYSDQNNVHDLPAIFHYWSNKYILPMCKEAGFENIHGFFANYLYSSSIRSGNNVAHFVSIGSGNCDLEINVAKELLQHGCDNFVLECLEINIAMLDRGRELAKQEGVEKHLIFTQADFNTWVATKSYDGIMANQSLHHVTNLEHLFEQVYKSLHDKGAFIVNDMIGRNGHQRWPEALVEVHKLWDELPRSHTCNRLHMRFEPVYENWDCSAIGFEGIRAQDVLPLLIKFFEFEKFIAFGNVIDIFIDRPFGHNFDPENEWDRNFIDRAHRIDEKGIMSGSLTPTHLFGVLRKELVDEPFYYKGLNPKSCVRHIS
jgi:SAM-dependent methyltransferase